MGLVFFYGDRGCPYCVDFRSRWSQLARSYSSVPGLVFAAVNCEVYPEACTLHGQEPSNLVLFSVDGTPPKRLDEADAVKRLNAMAEAAGAAPGSARRNITDAVAMAVEVEEPVPPQQRQPNV